MQVNGVRWPTGAALPATVCDGVECALIVIRDGLCVLELVMLQRFSRASDYSSLRAQRSLSVAPRDGEGGRVKVLIAQSSRSRLSARSMVPLTRGGACVCDVDDAALTR
jgi:hypothetical protein